MSGCSALPAVYNPNNIPNENLSRIYTFPNISFFEQKYHAWIEYIWDDSGTEITNRNAWEHGKMKMYALPSGTYTVQASCFDGAREANPKSQIRVEPSKLYEISCVVKKGKMLGLNVDMYATIEIKEITQSEVDAHLK